MIAGHFGFAAAVKAKAPRVPLWALMLASVWMDVIFVPLFVAHVETIDVIGGGAPGYGNGIIHADWTHSLAGALVISAVFAAVAGLVWDRAVAVVLGAVVFSHWLLDLPMHHHDMPLLPANAGHLPLLGFGLWAWPVASMLVELALVIGGAFLYRRAALRVAQDDPSATKRANVSSAILLASGVVTLALNVAGQ